MMMSILFPAAFLAVSDFRTTPVAA